MVLFFILSSSNHHLIYLNQAIEGILKKFFVCLAEIIFLQSVLEKVTVPAAASATQSIPLAFGAVFGRNFALLDKLKLLTFSIKMLKGVSIQIPKALVVQHVKIAGVNASVSLHDILHSAVPPHSTCFRRLSVEHYHKVVEISMVIFVT